MSEISIDWENIIYRGIESESLDYKAAQNWSLLSRPGKAKFVRHCLALANTKGGYVVIGVGEDKTGKPSDYTGVTPAQAKSFDPTIVGDFVNRFADPPIDFDVARPVVDDKQYVVFVVRRFSTLPHVCNKGCIDTLQQGAFYIRSPEASSRVAHRSSEIHGIVQRALRNQRAMLGRMLKGILFDSKDDGAVGESKKSYAAQQDDSRKAAEELNPLYCDGADVCCFEVSVNPSTFVLDQFTLSEIRHAVEESVFAYSNGMFFRQKSLVNSYLTNVSLKSYDENTGQFWQAFQSGFFHFVEIMKSDNKGLEYGALLKKLASTAAFIAGYYYELGYEGEMLNMRFTLTGVEGFKLGGIAETHGRRKSNGFVCKIPVIDVKKMFSSSDVHDEIDELASDLIIEVCERFNVPQSRHRDLVNTVRCFLESRAT